MQGFLVFFINSSKQGRIDFADLQFMVLPNVTDFTWFVFTYGNID